MPMTLQLTEDQVEALRNAAYPFCVQADVEAALSRYPGMLGQGDCFPSTFTLNTLTKSCIGTLALENKYFSRSFLLRLIEQKWDAETVRRGVVGAVPALVRPPRGFDTQIAALSSAIELLIARIPAKPSSGNIGDVIVFGRFCEARDAIATMVASLDGLETLKAAHDGLHMLQVLGAGWLDAFSVEAGGDLSTGPLLALLARVRKVTAVETTGLPPDVAAGFARCVMSTEDAERRIRTGDSGEIAFACATLRAMLIRELPLIDAAMFTVSRDFPLRQLCSLFPSDPSMPVLDAAREAAIDLADTLRRRLMEHALWQATDLRVYALEQTLSQPSAILLSNVQKLLPWLLRDLRVLLDTAVADAVLPAMNDAVLRHVLATDGQAPPGAPPPTGTLDTVRGAFRNLRRCARSAFLDVDQALRLDVARLVGLKGPLQAILERVPGHCALLVPV